MNDNDIIKALGYCFAVGDCEHCIYADKPCQDLMGDALNLINRQKAEIERLKKEIESLESIQEISPEAKHFVDTKADKVISLLNEVIKSQEQIKAEAIKEFAERLKRDNTINNTEDGCLIYSIDYGCLMEDIDNFVEEMTEEKG